MFSHSVMSNYLWPHGLQHDRLLCTSSSPRVTQTRVHWVDDANQPSHPLSFPSPPAFYISQHQDLFHELALYIMWPKYWNFSISPSNEYSELISFRTDWFDLLAVQGTLKSLVQYHNLKASVFSTQPFLWSNSHIRTWLLEKPWLWLNGLCWQSDVSNF